MATPEVETKKPNRAPKTARSGANEPPALDVGALVDAHPVGALAAALGVGYALGGGLFTSLTSRLLGWGFRLGVQFAVLPVLERELVDLAGRLGQGLQGEAASEPASGAGSRPHH